MKVAGLESNQLALPGAAVSENPSFVDIHCHLIPGIDDGSKSWEESLEMARIAVGDGIGTVICTPHQLGNFTHNEGETIRQRAEELQRYLEANGVPLKVLPGADVRIEPEMITRLLNGSVLSLADRRRHVLLELPHELYFPLEPVLDELEAAEMVGILSHPERNQGLLTDRHRLPQLVEYGCLMQVTAGSLVGTFGPESRELAEWMITRGLVHFIATDAHGPKSRRPLMRRAYDRVAELAGQEAADQLCRHNPAQVAQGGNVQVEVTSSRRMMAMPRWLQWRKAG